MAAQLFTSITTRKGKKYTVGAQAITPTKAGPVAVIRLNTGTERVAVQRRILGFIPWGTKFLEFPPANTYYILESPFKENGRFKSILTVPADQVVEFISA